MDGRHRLHVAVPLAALALVALAAATRPGAPGAVDPPWDPPPCLVAQAEQVVSWSAPERGAGAWFRLAPILDARGWLEGQALLVGTLAEPEGRRLALPEEAFASGPVAGRVLVGDDDGDRSRLRLVDPEAGCAVELGSEQAVIRGALLEADGSAVLEHRVDRVTRADLGVWRRRLPGGQARRVLPPLGSDDDYGPTFTTGLALAADGRLVVASCGGTACRVRVLDPRTGRTVHGAPTGRVLGVVGETLVAYRPCPGLPCGIERIDLATGRRTTVVAAAGLAALGGPGGRLLIHEGTNGGLATIDLDAGSVEVLPDVPAGLAPVATGDAQAGASLDAGEVLLAPGGRFSLPGTARRLDPARPAVHRLEEVLP